MTVEWSVWSCQPRPTQCSTKCSAALSEADNDHHHHDDDHDDDHDDSDAFGELIPISVTNDLSHYKVFTWWPRLSFFTVSSRRQHTSHWKWDCSMESYCKMYFSISRYTCSVFLSDCILHRSHYHSAWLPHICLPGDCSSGSGWFWLNHTICQNSYSSVCLLINFSWSKFKTKFATVHIGSRVKIAPLPSPPLPLVWIALNSDPLLPEFEPFIWILNLGASAYFELRFLINPYKPNYCALIWSHTSLTSPKNLFCLTQIYRSKSPPEKLKSAALQSSAFEKYLLACRFNFCSYIQRIPAEYGKDFLKIFACPHSPELWQLKPLATHSPDSGGVGEGRVSWARFHELLLTWISHITCVECTMNCYKVLSSKASSTEDLDLPYSPYRPWFATFHTLLLKTTSCRF